LRSINIEEQIYKPGAISFGLLTLLCSLVYLPSLYFDFFFLDDSFHIVDNPRINLSVENFFWFWKNSDVPVVYNFWQVIGFFGNGEAYFYRFINILLHLLNSIILFKVTFSLTSKFAHLSKSISILVAVIFLIHPLQVESVVWVSSFRSTLATFFMFLAILRYDSRTNFKDDLLIITFYMLGILSKPIIGVLPVFLFVFDFFLNKKDLKKAILMPYVLLPGIFLIGYFVKVLLPKSVIETDLGMVERLLVLIDSLYFYFLKSFFPLMLSSIYGKSLEQVVNSFSSSSYVLTLVGFTLVLLGICFYSARKKNFLMIFGLAFFIIFYIPTSGLFNFHYQIISTVADRYMYIPIIGISIIGIALWQSLRNADIGRMINHLLNSLGVAFLLAMISTSVVQVSLWKNEIELLVPAAKTNPDSYHVQLAIGTQLIKRGQAEQAIPNLKKAYELREDNFEAALFLTQAYSQIGNLDGAKKIISNFKIDSAAHLPILYSYIDGLSEAGYYQEAEDLAAYFSKKFPYDFGINTRLNAIKAGGVHRSLYVLKNLLKSEVLKENPGLERVIKDEISRQLELKKKLETAN